MMSFSKFYKATLINELFTSDIPVEWDKDAIEDGLIMGSFTAPNGRVFVIKLNRGPDNGYNKKEYLELCKYNKVKPPKEILRAYDNNTLWELEFRDAKQERLSQTRNVKDGAGILGTGNASFVFSAVIHGLMDITLDVPSIKVISFLGHNASRISLYSKLIRSLGQKLSWKGQELESDLITDLTYWYLYR
jgi:hypothetical protein